MITCSVCKTQNDEYAVTCVSCRSFIQNRIPNLDFFDTVWKVIETPRKAFHDITLAEHKNYSFVLFSLFGIALSMTGFWYFRLGLRFDSLLDLLAKAAGVGVVLGIVCAGVFTGVFELLVRIFGGKGNIRSSLGVLAYATTPVSLSLVLILPVELLTFGMYLFTWNPNPYTIKPGLFVTLIAVDGLIGLWAFVLGVVGAAVGKQMTAMKSFVAIAGTVGGCLGGLFLAAKYLLQFV